MALIGLLGQFYMPLRSQPQRPDALQFQLRVLKASTIPNLLCFVIEEFKTSFSCKLQFWWQRVDTDFENKLIDQFENEIKAGDSPQIENYLGQWPEESRSAILLELISLEIFHNLKKGRSVSNPDYARFGNSAANHAELVSKLCHNWDGEKAIAKEGCLPSHIGDYKILREIGRGGMGVVYEAEHVALGRKAALKVLSARMSANAVALSRFRREAKTIAKLHHTNIVPLFEFGEDHGVAFLAMQLIQGRSLDHVISDLNKGLSPFSQSPSRTAFGSGAKDGGPDEGFRSATNPAKSSSSGSGSSSARVEPYRSIARIGLQAADALWYAHNRDVIHRDIKPSNLILDESGVVWLTDFGLAKLEEDGDQSSQVTQSGDMLGTLRYMAPERFEGHCDASADTYSLGLTLYELLVQRPAFHSSSKAKLINSITKSEPARPRSIELNIPRDLETIVLKASNKEQSARYHSARELAEDLDRFLRDEPIRARRVSLLERTCRWAKRNQALASSLAMIAILLITGLIGVSFSAMRFREQAEVIEQELYHAEMLLAGRELEKLGGISNVRDLMRNWIPTPGEVDRRGPEWHFYYGLSRDELHSFQHPSPVTTAQFSPDDQWVATGAEDGMLRLWDVNSGRLVKEIQAHESTVNDVAFSPDGKLVVTAGVGNSAKAWNVESGELVGEVVGHRRQVTSVAFRGDGECFATGAMDGIRFWNIKTFELMHHCSVDNPDTIPISEMSWHPHIDRLLTISRDDTMLVWDPDSGEIDETYAWINELPGLEFWFGNYQIHWNPSADRILAIGQWNALIDLPVGETPRKGHTFEQQAGVSRCGGWSKDGKYFILGGESLELFFFDAKTQKEVGRIRGHEGIITDFCLDSDGTKIVTASNDGTAKIWRFPDLPKKEGLWAEGGLALSPDAKRVALSGGTSNELLIADLETESIIGRFQSPAESWLGFVTWDPTGKNIAVACGTGETDSIVYVVDGESGDLLRTFNPDSSYIQFLAWHPQIDGLLAVGQSTELPMEFWDSNTGKLVEKRDYHTWAWNAVDWSPDGRWLACAGWRPEIVDWHDRENKISIEGFDSVPTAAKFSNDGKLLAIADQEAAIRYYETGTWKHLGTMTGHAGPVLELQWGPGNQRLASIGSDGTLRLWDPSCGKVVLSHDFGSKPRSLQWSEDGNTIVVSASKRMHVFDLRVSSSSNRSAVKSND